jgi:hypothetical protein
MFSLRYTSPYKEEIKTIKFKSPDGKKNNPIWQGLGWYIDVDGVKWDIRGVLGGERPYVWARPVDNLPIYRTDIESFGMGYSATWLPYYVEIVRNVKDVKDMETA